MLNQREKPLENPVAPAKPRKALSAPKMGVVETAKKAASAKKPTAKKSAVARPVLAGAASAPEIAHQEIAQNDIARLAYHLWEARGGTDRAGSPEEDWLRAEALLRSGSTTVS
jgi:Protein of unknown function (DUF2934)